jgi:hypothetical protein
MLTTRLSFSGHCSQSFIRSVVIYKFPFSFSYANRYFDRLLFQAATLEALIADKLAIAPYNELFLSIFFIFFWSRVHWFSAKGTLFRKKFFYCIDWFTAMGTPMHLCFGRPKTHNINISFFFAPLSNMLQLQLGAQLYCSVSISAMDNTLRKMNLVLLAHQTFTQKFIDQNLHAWSSLSIRRNCGAVSTHRCNEAEDYNPPPVLLIGTQPLREAGDIFSPHYK